MHFLWLTHITGSLNLLLLTTVLTFWTHSAVASFFPLSITCLPWGQMEDMVLGTDRRHLFFSILSPLLQTCHFHRTHSHQYSYYLTVSGGTYVCLKICFSSSIILWRKHQMSGLCYADDTNYKESCFLNIPVGNTYNGKALLEHHLKFQSPRFKASQPGQSKLQALKCPAFCVKPQGHALVILDYLGHSGKEV